jgi:DNA-binding transcriptional ArsR family regulator
MAVSTAPAQPAQTFAGIFSALSDPTRVQVLSMIAATDELACTVLDATLPISKSTLSYHIKVLYHAGLINIRKAGRFYFYRVRQETFSEQLPGFLDRLKADA